MKHRGVVCVTRSVAEVYLTYSMDEHFQFKLPYDTDSISIRSLEVNAYFKILKNFSHGGGATGIFNSRFCLKVRIGVIAVC